MKIKLLTIICTAIFIATSFNIQPVFAVAWTEQTGSGSRSWSDIASSYDGTKLAAAVSNGYIYTSVDSGVTWTARTSPGVGDWVGIASSSDGTRLLALEYYTDSLWISNNSGDTWIERPVIVGNNYWVGMAASSDGAKIILATAGSNVYTSTDSGATWTQQAGAGFGAWYNIASSADGTKLIIASSNGYIKTSADSGVNWTERTSAGSRAWWGVASSSDGTKIVAVVQNGYIYTSTDSGATWAEHSSLGVLPWSEVVSSEDGVNLAATTFNGYIYTSTDSGVTWTAETSAGSRSWLNIASSSDGSKLAAVVQNGYIYTTEITVESSSTPSSYTFPPLCSATFTPSTITQGEQTTLSWSSSQYDKDPKKNAPYYINIPTKGIYSTRTSSITLKPSYTTTYELRATNLYGSNTCTATIKVLDVSGNEIVMKGSYLTANSIKSPIGSMIVDFFKKLFGKK
jgi:hypothetical protein